MSVRPWADLPARPLLALLLVMTLWRLALAWVLPVTQDEAYYFDWARSLAWGYFDHPPGVAVLGLGTWLAPGSALAGRIGTLLAATLSLLVLASFYGRCGLSGAGAVLALVLAVATVPGIGGAVIATPDTGLAFCWALALHESLPALQGERRRWLSAGLAVGLGLLAKYTMVLIGPVLLWALLRTDPRALRTPWPYAGALVALLVFSPHLIWNAQHDWVTMRFQLGHGFASEIALLPDNDRTDALPSAVPAKPPAKDKATRTPGERAASVLAYLGTQVALWGLLLAPALATIVQWLQRRLDGRGAAASARHDTSGLGTSGLGRAGLDTSGLDRAALPLLWAGVLVPLGFFAWIASLGSPEPNWPAMYLLSAAPLAALALAPLARWVWLAAAGNVLLISLYAWHAATAALPLGDAAERILRETHGYPELAQRVRALDGLVFADGYQTTAMLRFYQPGLALTQWPGVTRPSEYLRGVIAPPVSLEDVRRAGGFWLVGRRSSPPHIPGFIAQAPRVLIDCKGAPLVEVTGGSAQEETPPCPRPLHRWQLVRYVVAREEATPTAGG